MKGTSTVQETNITTHVTKKEEKGAPEKEKVVVKVGQKLWKDGTLYSYAGVIKDPKSKDYGKPTVKLEKEDVYEVWTKEQLDRGLSSSLML